MSQVNMLPPHISDPPQYPQGPSQVPPQPYTQGPLQDNKVEGVQVQEQSAAVIAQNYRDECQFNFVLC
jgi:hypothetical protein